MNGNERTKSRVNSMTKTEHAALPEQYVVGQARNDGNAHLSQYGARQITGEDQRGTD
jgi:hypothetical protein